MATEEQSPFWELSQDDQKAVMDVAALILTLTTRIPGATTALYRLVTVEFIKAFAVPNKAKYAMQQVDMGLRQSDWQFTITKNGDRIITSYQRLGKDGQEEIK